MATEQSKAHHVGEWAAIRATSPEIAEAIFEVAEFDEKLAQAIWADQGNNDVLVKAFAKTDQDVLTWDNKVIERKNV
ncbi:YccJ family protein [Pantoea sp. 1.19]|uniref:YccJ family protein n=1 Tax=Pantoea sp. 1.19 TaxID=1925589 RepID=UPI000948CB3E|nr:YccJ family protein [Pantoea sp. 1.19]